MGTSIIDVRDPTNPTVVSHVTPPDQWSHTHKVRVKGDIMITNVEMDRRHFLRKGEKIASLRKQGLDDSTIALQLGVSLSDFTELEDAQTRGYHSGGFRVWDVADKSTPRLLSYVKTFGFGVHNSIWTSATPIFRPKWRGMLVIYWWYMILLTLAIRRKFRAGTCQDNTSLQEKFPPARGIATGCITQCV